MTLFLYLVLGFMIKIVALDKHEDILLFVSWPNYSVSNHFGRFLLQEFERKDGITQATNSFVFS